jgi:hypothetical protein
VLGVVDSIEHLVLSVVFAVLVVVVLPVLDVGIMAALGDVGWDVGKFLTRSGVYNASRRNEIKGCENISKKGSSMSRKAASRIQSHADKSGTNQGFKARAQSVADSNEK